MPLEVFLCHAPADREIADRIKVRLDRGAEANVWLEECGRDTAQTLASAWEGGTSSAAILLLLSPGAIPQRMPREHWQPLLEHLGGNAEPPVAGILLGVCAYPPLLERRHFFRWDDDATATLRKIERWILGLHLGEPPSLFPAPLSWFQGHDREIEAIWTALVDQPGTFLLEGEAAVAQEFARAASGHFRDILWIGCGDRSQASVTGEIAVQLGSSSEHAMELLGKHRLLLVLDDVRGEPPVEAPSDGRTSVLIIRRPLERDLPIRAKPASNPRELALWEAMSACRPQDISLELAARIANMSAAEARVAAARLAADCCIDPLDTAGTRFRLVAGFPGGEPLRRRHAEVLNEAFSKWTTDLARCRRLFPDVEAALDWTLVSDWPIATRLAGRAAAFLKAEGRLEEAVLTYNRLRDAARERWDIEVFDNCSEELRWIQNWKGGMHPPPFSPDQLRFNF